MTHPHSAPVLLCSLCLQMCSAENFAYRLAHASPFFKAAVTTQQQQPNDASSEDASAEDATAASNTDAVTAVPPPRVLGFVVGTLSDSSALDHSSMFAHSPSGRFLCIHSVVTATEVRRRGIAKAMIREYGRAVREEQGGALSAIVLMCKRHLISFYESVGFVLVGPSTVVHGEEEWFECRMKIDDGEQQQQRLDAKPAAAVSQ